MADPITLTDDELAEAVCRRLEPDLPRVTARQVRAAIPGFVWVSCHDYYSPGGWWVAEIGTDHNRTEHGSDLSRDDEPVRWRPLPELAEDVGRAWEVVEEMRRRGWLCHVLTHVDGYSVTAREYILNGAGWQQAINGPGLVQEIGDTAEEAILRACVAALPDTKAGE
jgi:hypothetical protein